MRLPEHETVLNAYRKRRGWTLRRLGELLGVSTQSAGRYCLQKTHKDHCRPNQTASDLLRVVSGGEVTVANYADPYLPPSSEAGAGVTISDGITRAERVPGDIQ